MKVLVIPDIHLKSFIFTRAAELLRGGLAEKAVCLMDIPDDWGQQNNLDLYIQTFETAKEFAREFPQNLWCYGNHDVCYLWNRRESGYSEAAAWIVKRQLSELADIIPAGQLSFVHRIDRVLFSHGGLAAEFVREHVPEEDYRNADRVLEIINRLGPEKMWRDNSPIWFRPFNGGKCYTPGEDGDCLQVAGHTPLPRIGRKKDLVVLDTFSTDRERRPVSTQEYLLVDTETLEWSGVK